MATSCPRASIVALRISKEYGIDYVFVDSQLSFEREKIV